LAVEHGNPVKTGELTLGSAQAEPTREGLPEGQKDKRWCAGFMAGCTSLLNAEGRTSSASALGQGRDVCV